MKKRVRAFVRVKPTDDFAQDVIKFGPDNKVEPASLKDWELSLRFAHRNVVLGLFLGLRAARGGVSDCVTHQRKSSKGQGLTGPRGTPVVPA